MLTEARCKAAKPGERPDGLSKRLMLRDERGLYLQVDQGAEGVIKSWLYRYTVSGKDRTVGLGSYPEVNLADARRLADAQRAIRAAGRDLSLLKNLSTDDALVLVARWRGCANANCAATR